VSRLPSLCFLRLSGLAALVILALPLRAADYLVIDLSAGSAATSYPVTTLATPSLPWTDDYKTTKLVLRRIPAGTFAMGSPDTELGRRTNETRHTVTLTQDFLIGVFEVTQRQWELVMGTRPSYFNHDAHYAKRPVERVSFYTIRENAGADDPSASWPANTHVHPSSFIGRLRARTGLAGLDLPTEAQWEYACRAGTNAAFNNGGAMDTAFESAAMNTLGRYVNNSGTGTFTAASDATVGTAHVGSYQPNAWGLYDLHGNVWEICVDRYAADYGPGNTVNPLGATTGTTINMKGGGMVSNAANCRSARRRDDRTLSSAAQDYGFRLASHTVPAAMLAVDQDGDGFRAELAPSHPLHDPDDTDPYTPFVDTNGNYVPDNYGNDAASPLADHAPRLALHVADGTVRADLRLSVGPRYRVLQSLDLRDWTPVSIRLDGATTTEFRSPAPRLVTGVELPSTTVTRVFYKLESTTIPAP
jgi:formylglycine-generating enzyme required for sulfatase activity